jgi:hypothetical protein
MLIELGKTPVRVRVRVKVRVRVRVRVLIRVSFSESNLFNVFCILFFFPSVRKCQRSLGRFLLGLGLGLG